MTSLSSICLIFQSSLSIFPIALLSSLGFLLSRYLLTLSPDLLDLVWSFPEAYCSIILYRSSSLIDFLSLVWAFFFSFAGSVGICLPVLLEKLPSWKSDYSTFTSCYICIYKVFLALSSSALLTCFDLSWKVATITIIAVAFAAQGFDSVLSFDKSFIRGVLCDLT